MKFEFIMIYFLILIMAVVIGGMVLQSEQNTAKNNLVVSEHSNQEILSNLKALKNDTYNYYLSEFKEIQRNKNVCDPTYILKLPEDRDRLYITLSYVADAQDYKLDEYDCTEKAELLVILLKELGYKKVRTKHVNVNCEVWDFGASYTYEDCKSNDGGHLIVDLDGIYIEATSGRFIVPEDYNKYGL